jgi:hypothetical protein
MFRYMPDLSGHLSAVCLAYPELQAMVSSAWRRLCKRLRVQSEHDSIVGSREERKQEVYVCITWQGNEFVSWSRPGWQVGRTCM